MLLMTAMTEGWLDGQLTTADVSSRQVDATSWKWIFQLRRRAHATQGTIVCKRRRVSHRCCSRPSDIADKDITC